MSAPSLNERFQPNTWRLQEWNLKCLYPLQSRAGRSFELEACRQIANHRFRTPRVTRLLSRRVTSTSPSTTISSYERPSRVSIPCPGSSSRKPANASSSWWNTSDGCDTYYKGAVPCVGVASRKCHVERVHFLLDSIEKVFSKFLTTTLWKGN